MYFQFAIERLKFAIEDEKFHVKIDFLQIINNFITINRSKLSHDCLWKIFKFDKFVEFNYQ